MSIKNGFKTAGYALFGVFFIALMAFLFLGIPAIIWFQIDWVPAIKIVAITMYLLWLLK